MSTFSLWLKKNYYVRRLAPFLIVYFIYELAEITILALLQQSGTDWHATTVLRLLGNLVVETCSSFLYLIIPYLLYLSALPKTFHGGKTDRVVTLIFFTVFCLLNSCEEMVEILTGDHFSFYSRQFLQVPGESWNQIATTVPIFPVSVGILVVSAGTVAIFFKKLVPRPTVPAAPIRAAIPVLACALAFILSWGSSLPLSESAKNTEIAKDGLFSFFGDLFAITTIPHLPSIFGIPTLIIGGFLLLLLIIEHLPNALIPENSRPSSLASSIFRSMKKQLRIQSDFSLLLILFLGAILLLRVISMGAYPLMDTTEARYAEMSRKMLETNHWLVPQFDYGVPFWGKPPLSFWASAITMKLGGINEWSARLAPFLASLVMGLLFFAWPFRSLTKQKATACFLILASSGIGFVSSGAVMTDEFLALGIMLSMISFWKTISQTSVHPCWKYLFFVGLAIGLMSKGPLALVLTGFPLTLWTFWNKKWKQVLHQVPWLRGCLLMLALSLPWYLLAEKETPGFLHYFIVGEHFQRFLVKGWQGDLYGSGHASPIGTIWLYGLTMFLPWTILLPFLRRKTQPESETNIHVGEKSYLLLWALSPLIFFTFARNILPAYVLPGIPACCLLTVQTLWKRDRLYPGMKNLIFFPASVFAIMTIFLLGDGFGQLEYRCQKQLLSNWDRQSPLYCWDNVRPPYSAQFYSAGKVQRLTPGTLPPPGTGSPYMIVKRTDYNRYESLLVGWHRKAEERRWLLLTAPSATPLENSLIHQNNPPLQKK